MSRVAKNPIEIVEGVDVNVDKNSIEVKGKLEKWNLIYMSLLN